MDTSSPEYLTITKCFGKLIIALEQKDIVHFLYSQNFISRDECDIVLNPQSMRSDNEKARVLAKKIRDKIDLDSHNFYILQEGFRNNENYREIVDILNSELLRQKGNSIASQFCMEPPCLEGIPQRVDFVPQNNGVIQEVELQHQSMKMTKSFLKMKKMFYNFIKLNNSESKIKELKIILRDSLTFGPIRMNDPHELLTYGDVHKLTDIAEIIDIISSYSSFYNYTLLKDAIEIINFEEGRAQMKQYEEEFQRYIKRRVIRCPCGVGMTGENHVIVKVSLDSSFKDCRQVHLFTLRDNLCEILDIDQIHLQLEGIEIGSIVVIFHLVNSLKEIVFPLSEENVERLQSIKYINAKVLHIECEDYFVEVNTYEGCLEDYIQLNEDLITTPAKEFRQSSHNFFLQYSVSIDSYHGKVHEGDLSSFKRTVLGSPYNPLEKDHHGHTALHWAIIEENSTILKFLLEECGCAPTSANIDKNTILHLAAYGGNLELVKYLVNNDPTLVNLTNVNNLTPVHVAVIAGQFSVLKFLVSQGDMAMNDSHVNGTKLNMFHMAIGSGNLNVVSFLVTNFPTDLSEDSTAVILSVHHLKILQFLFERIEFSNQVKYAALFAAAFHGHFLSFKYLVMAVKYNSSITDAKGKTPFYYAARNGHIEILKFLVRENFIQNIEIINDAVLVASQMAYPEVVQWLFTEYVIENNCAKLAYYNATLNGSYDLVKYFIEHHHFDAKVGELYSPLVAASQNGHLKIVKYLIENRGCNPKSKNVAKNTPVYYAALNGHLQIVQYLIEDQFCYPNVRGHNGMTPLHVAASNGHLQIVQYLLEDWDCDFSITDSDNNTPLHLASINGHLEVVKYFLGIEGCSPGIKGQFGMTLMHAAAGNGQLKILRYLMEDLCCDPSETDKNGSTSFHHACINGHFRAVKYLSKMQYVFGILNDMEAASILIAACRSGQLEIVTYLVNKMEYMPDSRDNRGDTPLHFSAAYGQLNILRYFIEDLQHDVSIKGQNEQSLLHVASSNGHLDVIKYLIHERYCDTMVQDIRWKTPLHYACAEGNMDAANFLLDNSPSHYVLMCDIDGNTALHDAASNNEIEVLKYLIEEHCINPCIQNKDRYTPAMMAYSAGHQTLGDYLITGEYSFKHEGKDYENVNEKYLGSRHVTTANIFVHSISGRIKK